MNVLAISGSLRAQSTTTRALRLALEGASLAGASTELVELDALGLPWCDGRPEGASYGPAVDAWRARVVAADAMILGSPEYHGSPSGVLKNALDLLDHAHMQGKLIGLVATARGDAGAMNTLNHLRHVARWVDAWVLPAQVSIPRAQEAFGPEGAVLRPGLADELSLLGAELVRYARLLRGGVG
jgi:NAD(P)H-dependent FMN reductase